MDMFNQFINLYNNGRFFRQKSVARDYWTEDPTNLTDLLVTDSQWYEQYFRGTSKCLTALLRHNNSYEFQRIRRNRFQGDIALIDFLLTANAAQLSEALPSFSVGPGSLHEQAALHLWHGGRHGQPQAQCDLQGPA